MQLGLAGTGCSGPTVSARRAWETGKPQAEEKGAEYLRSVHALGYKVPCPTEQQYTFSLAPIVAFAMDLLREALLVTHPLLVPAPAEL